MTNYQINQIQEFILDELIEIETRAKYFSDIAPDEEWATSYVEIAHAVETLKALIQKNLS